MTTASRSYLKTAAFAAVAGAVVFAVTMGIASIGGALPKLITQAIGWPLGLLSELVAASGLLVVYRSLSLDLGKPDLFLRFNAARTLDALSADGFDPGLSLLRLLRAVVRGSWLLAGDVVEIRSLEQIRNTLDASGCYDGLPFMAEMAAFCGRRARVFRVVDKIYDYGRSNTLRRLKDAVLLDDLRCDGSAHGGCQASCYMIWNRRWLRRVPRAAAADLLEAGDFGAHMHPRRVPAVVPAVNGALPTRYECQYTQLAVASTPLRPWDLRQDVRPLLSGNVTLRAFAVAVLTRLFNAVQAYRGGSGFPAMARGVLTKTPLVVHDLASGSRVRVLSRDQIAATLDVKGRNRGLWFDLDMIKYCGGRYTVAKRVQRIIDAATGRMLEMKTPSIVLQGADASGEFLHFCPQHEQIFWRESWLAPESTGTNTEPESLAPRRLTGPLA